jgi:two-component system NtrC family sensor kinase
VAAQQQSMTKSIMPNSQPSRLTTIKLLQLSIVAALTLPALVFAYMSFITARNAHAIADERIDRSLDVLQEQAVSVFRSVDATLNTVERYLDGKSNADISADAARISERLKSIDDDYPEIQSIWIFDQAGNPLATNRVSPAPTTNFGSEDYIQAQVTSAQKRFISAIHQSTTGGESFFAVSRARTNPGGTLAGVIEVSVLPSDFSRFYGRLVSSGGLSYALIREDGIILARHPIAAIANPKLDDRSGFGKTIAVNPAGGFYTAKSEVDGTERRFGARKVPNLPLYLSAGVDTSSIRYEWMSTMATHLFFGIPATLLLVAALLTILARTQRLYEEQDRRELAETALRQTQKMDAVGQLTGGIAHDFNNLLTIIIGNLDSADRQFANWNEGSHARAHRAVGNAMKGARRAVTLTQRLLAFSRRAPHKPETIDANKLLFGLSDFLTRSLGEKVSLEFVGAAGVWTFQADRGELEAALVNLAVNARDAMPDGGKLTIETRNAYLDDAYSQRHAEVSPGQYVLISVTDNGTGMSADAIEHAFEPFYTTKAAGQGTGLGLSQVYGFVKQSGGHIKIYSELGYGTTVKLYLPRATGEALDEKIVAPAVTVGAGETIFVVEDDADVRAYVVETLRALNYKVRHASSAEAALEAMEEQPFDLLLTDVVLPGMNGRQLAETIIEQRPSTKTLYMTGYSRNAIIHQGRLDPGIEMIQKPLTSSELSAKVRKLLDG